MNSCDIINKIHVNLDVYPKHTAPAFSLIPQGDTISVYGCVWSKFEFIDKYEQIIKVDKLHKSTG
jgi:hypothetical protein